MHGDVKPSNIIVDHSGRAQLIDFSLCCGVGERVRGGTRKYLPPEREHCDLADPGGDQYSLAASIVDSLSGVLPTVEASPLTRVLQRAIATEPADRFDTVAELGDALERVRTSTCACRFGPGSRDPVALGSRGELAMSQHDPSFGAHIRRLREARALTRQEVAELGGLAVDTIGKIERDEVSPALQTVRKLAKGLGIAAPSELLAYL